MAIVTFEDLRKIDKYSINKRRKIRFRYKFVVIKFSVSFKIIDMNFKQLITIASIDAFETQFDIDKDLNQLLKSTIYLDLCR